MLSVKLLVLLFFLPSVAANLQINEVMYAPNDGNEWVEIYNPTSQAINLSGWGLIDNQNTDTLGCCSFDQACSLLIPALSYALITDQDTTLYSSLTTNALKICVDDNSLGNGLSNSGDSLKIFNGTYENQMVYNSTYADKNGRSLEYDNGFWRESYILGGTPGLSNSQVQQAILNTNNTLNSTSQLDVDQQAQINPFPEKITPKFEVTKLVKEVTAGKSMSLDVTLSNSNLPHTFKVWSYAYSGSKCISCGSGTREANQQTVFLDANDRTIVSFNLNIPEDTLPGEYKMKVKILIDGKKTPHEIKDTIRVINKSPPPQILTQISNTVLENNFTENRSIKESLSSTTRTLPEDRPAESTKVAKAVVYQSKEKKVKKLIPYFVVVTIVILASIYISKSYE